MAKINIQIDSSEANTFNRILEYAINESEIGKYYTREEFVSTVALVNKVDEQLLTELEKSGEVSPLLYKLRKGFNSFLDKINKSLLLLETEIWIKR